jgi:hydrogenase-4 component B
LIKTLLITLITAYLAGAVLPLLFHKNNRINIPVAYGLALIGSLAGIITATLSLLSAKGTEVLSLHLFPSPLFGPGSITLDALSAFFLLTISVVSFAVSIYAPPYMEKTAGNRTAAGFGALFNIFLLSLVIVVMIDNAFYFLVFWELMTLISYFLVVFDYKKIETAKAGFQYLVMTHVGTGFILFTLIALSYYSGSLNFADFNGMQSNMPATLKNTVFIAALLGFSTKAGMVPLHVWLPRAHPAAPSHISALMSGVMIKTGIYGLIRIAFDFLAPAPWWWGLLIIAPAVLSAVLGVMYALMEQDVKRLLAFSSVENVGIIMIGVGLSVIFSAFGLTAASVLSLTAAMFHLINHAVFKGLLFLGAGSIHYATGLRNIEQMGGLLKKMPVTGALFLIGSLAISAIPPFNGFASEWLTFQSILQAGLISNTTVQLLVLLTVPALALTGGLAAATFIKAFGFSFLALPRDERAAKAEEVPLLMRMGMGVLGVLCVALGVGSSMFIQLPLKAAGSLFMDAGFVAGTATKLLSMNVYMENTIGQNRSLDAISIFVVLPALAIACVIAFLMVRIRGPRSITIGPTWDCGIPVVTSRMQYSATAFSRPLKVVFKAIYRPQRQIEIDIDSSPYYPATRSYESSIHHVFERQIYQRAVNTLLKLARRVRVIQAGNINLYLAYIFVTLLAAIVFTWR